MSCESHSAKAIPTTHNSQLATTMAHINPFKAIRPAKDIADIVSAPSESGHREEAKLHIKKNPNSYLNVVKPFLHFDDEKKIPEKHYTFGREYLERLLNDGILIREELASYYIYRNIVGSKAYTGIIAAASVDDYLNGIILKHENTLTEKQHELMQHVQYIKTIGCPVLLTYPDNAAIDSIVAKVTMRKPEYNFISDDQIKHNLWPVNDTVEVAEISSQFAAMPQLYIADGHHRTAGAAAYSQLCRKNNDDREAAFNFFPVCLIPFSKLTIYEYHRLVKDSEVYEREFLDQVKVFFNVFRCGHLPFQPLQKGEFGLYIKGHAYQLSLKDEYMPEDILGKLDVSIVEKYILNNILHVTDSKTDKRLTFLDGGKGIGTLQHRIDSGEADLAITLYPTSIDELKQIAENNLIMPPKSTWIEPKLRTGLVVYEME